MRDLITPTRINTVKLAQRLEMASRPEPTLDIPNRSLDRPRVRGVDGVHAVE